MPKIRSVGKCLFCDGEFAATGISKHLHAHLTKEAGTLQSGCSFLIKIEEGYHSDGLFFLNLWVDGETVMKEIDDLLRDIWLECCGHLSSFAYPGNKKPYTVSYGDGMMDENDKLMHARAKDLFEKGLKLRYQYDFGSTTELELKVVEQYPIANPGNLTLLSRNEPLEILCELCGSEPAASICSVCYDGPNTFCKKCAKQHAKTCEDFADYAALRVVNSPRMGICAYEGGTIDKKRDGIFVRKKR